MASTAGLLASWSPPIDAGVVVSRSPYACSTPVDIDIALNALVRPLLAPRADAGLCGAAQLLEWVQIAVLNADQRGRRTWHAPRPSTATDGRRVAALPCWPGPDAWVAAVRAALVDTEQGRAARRRHRVALDRVVEFAQACASFAESRTGRHLTASMAKLTERAGLSSDQAVRSRRVLTAIGAQVQVSAGRHLRGIEILAARAHHGGTQRAIASEYSLTMPRVDRDTAQAEHGPVSNRTLEQTATPPGRRRSQPAPAATAVCAPLSPLGVVPGSSLEDPGFRKNLTSANPTSTRRQRSYSRTAPRPLALQRLAGQLAVHVRGLDQHGQHLGRICDVLATCGVDPQRWSARDVRNLLDHDGRTASLTWPNHLHDPAAYFAWRLRRIDWTQPSPTERDRDATAAARAELDELTGVHSRSAPASPETRAAARAAVAAALGPRRSPTPRRPADVGGLRGRRRRPPSSGSADTGSGAS